MKKETKTRFYLIRHGETQWNKEGRYQGMTDIPLSEPGLAQADLLGKRFHYLPLDALYVSPLQRAMATAKPIEKETGVKMVVDEHFREIHFGEWEGKSVPQLQQEYGETYEKFFENPFLHTFPGEGSFDKVMERSVAEFEQLLQKHKGEYVAIVSHGGLLRVMLVGILGMDLPFYRKTWLTNTSITVVDVMENGKRILITLNDKAHLELADLWKKENEK